MGLRGRSSKKTARIQPIVPLVARIYRWYVLNKKVGFEVANEKFESGDQVVKTKMFPTSAGQFDQPLVIVKYDFSKIYLNWFIPFLVGGGCIVFRYIWLIN